MNAQDDLFKESIGPGSRLDEELNMISEKLGITLPHPSQAKPSPGAEIDSQIRELRSAVSELQRQHNDSSKIRLRTLLEEEDKLFEQRENLLDRPRAEEPRLNMELDREKIHQAVERAIEDTHRTLKEAITMGEQSFEDALREGKLGLMDGIKAIVDFAIPSNDDKTPPSQQERTNNHKGRRWV